jgi:glycosyltransferase involved in cell wall biosynthesis
MAESFGIASSVVFHGWRDDIDVVIPLLDAVLMPSRYEGFPQVAVQAATAHVPVIGYAVGGLPELIPPGFTVPYGEENDLAAVVMGVLRGSLRWPAQQVARRATALCEPAQVADKIAALMTSAGSAAVEEEVSGRAPMS